MALYNSRIILNALSKLAPRGQSQAKLLDKCNGHVWKSGVCWIFSHNYHCRGYPCHTTKLFQCQPNNTTFSFHRNLTSYADLRAKGIGEMGKYLESVFKEKDVSEPKESAEYLIAHVIGQKTVSNMFSCVSKDPLYILYGLFS